MKLLLNLLAALALIATALAPVLHLNDKLSAAGMKSALLVAAVVWFAVAILRDRQQAS